MTTELRSSIVRYMLAAVALTGAFGCGIFGVASYFFHRGDQRSVEMAARLVSFNPVYLSRLSSYYPDHRTDLLLRAAALNPYSAQAWLQLGFDAEFHHRDFDSAERYYLRAAETSHQFLPSWTLTNFYFRRQNKPAFLQWARAALEITPYAAYPIFAEMQLVDGDHGRLLKNVPNRGSILEQYFIFLLNARQFAVLPEVVERLVSAAPPEYGPLFGLNDVIGPALDQVIGAGDVTEAARMWRDLSAAHWIPFLTPTAERPLTNGNFAAAFGHGFDWIPLNCPGTFLNRPKGRHEMEFELSGDQPENCGVLLQWTPVGPGRRYRLNWKAESDGLSDPAGLYWHVRTSNLDVQSPDLLAEHDSGWGFQTPANAEIALLTLDYRRPLGSTKAKGTLHLQSVSLAPE